MKHSQPRRRSGLGFCFGVMLCSLALNYWLMTGRIMAVQVADNDDANWVSSLVELKR